MFDDIIDWQFWSYQMHKNLDNEICFLQIKKIYFKGCDMAVKQCFKAGNLKDSILLYDYTLHFVNTFLLEFLIWTFMNR